MHREGDIRTARTALCTARAPRLRFYQPFDETKAFPPGFLIHAGCNDKNQMKKTLSGLHNGKNKRRNQMENKSFRSAQGEEQGD